MTVLRIFSFTLLAALASSVTADISFKSLFQFWSNTDDANAHRKLDWAFTKPPTPYPTTNPTAMPTMNPTMNPTQNPTVEPTMTPTDVPTFTPTASPTNRPTAQTILPSSDTTPAPTITATKCDNSYLTSENLNIALVVDLSFSTYFKNFSSSVDIGDINGDDKGNSILDAQVVAIQDLLVSIAESESLDNDNCEIELISFETDAKDHGVWEPLNDVGDSFNPALMDYIKNKLRAPTSHEDIYNTNNGFTNFDAALDVTVDYFNHTATSDRKNLLVFLSDGEPNVRGDGDSEGYCANTTIFWNGDGTVLECSDLNLEAGERHEFCRGDDQDCVENEAYQDCVRGPTECMNADAVMQFESEIAALTELNVERLAIGVGDESNIESESALWMIDNNPGKDSGVLPVQALNLEELTVALSSLCILNTDPPTTSPSAYPSSAPVIPSDQPSDMPSDGPSVTASEVPTDIPTAKPTESPTALPTINPTESPTAIPSASPTVTHSTTPTAVPTANPTITHSTTPTTVPTANPTMTPSDLPSDGPSMEPSSVPSLRGSTADPTGIPTQEPTGEPTSELDKFGDDDDTDDLYFEECPDDLLLLKQVGISKFPRDAVQIISQDTSTVTVRLLQTYTKSSSTVDHMFYSYPISFFSEKCFEEDDFGSDDTIDITLQCMVMSKIAVLDLWIADDISHGILSEGDNAEVPKCCHPDFPPATPVTHYKIEIKCVSECPEVTE